GRQLSGLEQGVAGGGQLEEGVLPDNRVIPLEDALVIGVPPVPDAVGVIFQAGVAAVLAIPFGERRAPAVLDGDEMGVRLLLARQDPGGAGKAERGPALDSEDGRRGDGEGVLALRQVLDRGAEQAPATVGGPGRSVSGPRG